MEKIVKSRPATKTITMPAIQTMTAYIQQHYRSLIVRRLNEHNATGKLIGILGMGVQNTHFNSKNCIIAGMDFWRVDRCHAIIDVKLRITANFGQTHYIILEIQADMSIGLDITLGNFYSIEDRPERDMIRMDSYMVPYLKRSELEEVTDFLLKTHDLFCLRIEKHKKAFALAERMGLKVTSLPLYKKQGTDSILYFRQSQVDIEIPGEDGQTPSASRKPEKGTATVDGGTIVINSRSSSDDGMQMAVLHECVHYELHFMFYRLQELHNSDLKTLGKKRVKVDRNKNIKNPIPWIEWQAKRGAYALLMPSQLFQEALRKCLADVRYADYYALKLESAEYALAKEYDFCKYRVRARAIQLNHIEAVGTLNYIGDRYIDPYDFCQDNYDYGAAYHIDPKSLEEVYETDADLRKRLDSGYYIYADGHVVINDPKYVVKTSVGMRLTSYAKRNADMCCLRFIHIYEDDTVYDLDEYYYGALNSDEEYNRDYFKFIDDKGLDETEKFQRLHKLLQEMPSTFSATLCYLMEKSNTTEEALSQSSGLSVNTINRRRNEALGKVYTAEQVVPLCIGLKLPPILSNQLLEMANIRFNPKNQQHSIYRIVLDCMYMDPLDEVQKKILIMGGKPFKDIHKAE